MPDADTLPGLLAHRRALLATLLTGSAGAVPLLGYAQSTSTAPKLDVPYVPTPQEVVDKMLELAAVKASDTVYDLGCGDGRIVVTAAKRFGARGVGYDLNPERIQEARANARSAGVENRVRFEVQDLFQADFAPATVVTLYLLPQVNQRLRPQLWRQLRPGTRIVSHAFDMGDEWPPERKVVQAHRTLYTWTIRPEHKKA